MSRRVILLLFVLLPVEALAQGVGVVVRTIRGPPADRQVIEALVAEAAAAQNLVPVTDLVSAARTQMDLGAVRRERLAALQKASDARGTAWRYYLAAEPEKAQAALVEARAFLAPALDLDGAPQLLAELSLSLGAVHLFAGQKEQARQAFAMAARLDTRRQVESPAFSPRVVAAYQAALGSPIGATVALDVRTRPDSRVEVDGRLISQMPARVAPGEHVVVVRKKGFVASGRVVSIDAAATVDVELVADEDASVLADDSNRFAVGLGAAEAKTLLESAIVFAKLDEAWLIGVTWQRGLPALLGQRCAPSPLRCGPVKEVGLLDPIADEADLRAAVERLLDDWKAPQGQAAEPVIFEDTRLLSPSRPNKTLPIVTTRSWWKNPWIWIGAATAAGAITGTAIVLGGDGTGTTRVLVPGCTFGGGC